MKDNKERAEVIFNNIADLTCVVAQRLRALPDKSKRTLAAERLKDDLKRYQT